MEYNPFHNIYDDKGTKLQGSLFGTAYQGANFPDKKHIADCFVKVPVTLQELYNGCIKTIRYERQTLELDGRTIHLSLQNKEIFVKPGYDEYTNLTFRGEGHQQYR